MRRLLRLQWGGGLPLEDDDASVVQRLCRVYGLQWAVGAEALSGGGRELRLRDKIEASVEAFVTTHGRGGYEPT